VAEDALDPARFRWKTTSPSCEVAEIHPAGVEIDAAAERARSV